LKPNKKIRTKIGDIFGIPITEQQIAFGQVLMNNGGVLRVATFDKLYDVNEAPAPEECIKESIVLLTDTTDALIWHGHWKIYETCHLPQRIYLNQDLNWDLTLPMLQTTSRRDEGWLHQ
jgi:hypothetical protein